MKSTTSLILFEKHMNHTLTLLTALLLAPLARLSPAEVPPRGFYEHATDAAARHPSVRQPDRVRAA